MSTAPAPTAGHAVRPEWMTGAPEAPRARVVRADDPLVRVVALPTVDELAEEPEHDVVVDEDERSGAVAVAWALGYRAGHDEGREQGRRAGHEEGLRLGMQQATERAVARNAQVLAELERAAGAHLDALDGLLEAVAARCTELAFAVAREVVGRELALSQDPGADAVRRALASLPGCTEATARLHPEDLERLDEDPGSLAAHVALRLVADPSLQPGDCVLSSGATTVDAGIDAALDRVREALGLGDDQDAAS